MLIGTINDMIDGEKADEQLVRDLVVLVFAHAIVSANHQEPRSEVITRATQLADAYLQEPSK